MAEKDASGSPASSITATGVDLSALLSVRQAIEVIDGTPVCPRIERLPLAVSRGYRLARDIIADRDYPPFAKSVMDGFAVRSADLKDLKPPAVDGRRERGSAPSVELKVIGEVAAGQVCPHAVGPGEAIAIMTGAPVPEGADAVVPVEDVDGAAWGATGAGGKDVGNGGGKDVGSWGGKDVGSWEWGSREWEDRARGGNRGALATSPLPTPYSASSWGGNRGTLATSPLPTPYFASSSGGNRGTLATSPLPTPYSAAGGSDQTNPTRQAGSGDRAQGSDCTAGTVILTRGVEMQAAQIAAAATVGAAEVEVFARPHVGVLSTGDELVPVDESPGPAQIRNSNNLMLVALLQRMGCEVTNLGTAPDQPKVIRRALEQGMRSTRCSSPAG